MTQNPHSMTWITEIIAAAMQEDAWAPQEIPGFIDDKDSPPADAVRSLKATKPYLFRRSNALKMDRKDYRKAVDIIRRTGKPPRS